MLKRMILKRVAENSEGTFGVLIFNYVPFALTLERPWRYNERNRSCIPQGEYNCERVSSPRFGDTFEVKGVKDRSNILFHKGNISDDTHGCILIGESFDRVLGSNGITASKEGFNEFMAWLGEEDTFELVILSYTERTAGY